MYGSAFRRASLALTFLRQISHTSTTGNSDLVPSNDERLTGNESVSNNLNVVLDNESNTLKLPNIPLPHQEFTVGHSSGHAHKRKRKSRKKRKERHDDQILPIPSIEISSLEHEDESNI